jgi:GNAT superfamily N-acetyltransferase
MEPVHPLDPSFYASAAELLSQAFFSNPCHAYMCPDSTKRLAQLEWLLGGNLRMHVEADREASFCLGRDAVVDAMGFWTRPDPVEIGPLAKIRAGVLAAPVRLGLDGFRRVLEVEREMGRHRREALGDTSYWYLNNMVVRERLRGSGIGTRLLRNQLDTILRDVPEAPVALATQRKENVTFYARLGFEEASDRMIGSASGAFRNWIMVHLPRSCAGRSTC